MNKVNLGEIIEELVSEKGLSNAQFAKSIGMARQNIRVSVFQKHSLDTDLVCRINEVLDCNLFDYYTCNKSDYTPIKATVTIEMGEQVQDKTFTFLFGDNKVEIK